MSEQSPEVRGVLVAHGRMAEGIVDAVRRISGEGGDALVPISNEGLGPAELADRVGEALGAGAGIVFTDLQSGSCAFAGRRLSAGNPDVVVLSGVNLPLLLEFVLHRDLPLSELVPRLLNKGRAGIGCTPRDLEDHVGRAVSGG